MARKHAFRSQRDVVYSLKYMEEIPIAYVTEEGGEYKRWDSPKEAFAVFYENGLIVDKVVGVYSSPEWITRVLDNFAAEERRLRIAAQQQLAREHLKKFQPEVSDPGVIN